MAFALATLGLAVLYSLGATLREVWHVYVIMFLRAVGGSFHWPAMQASTSLMVPEEHLSRVAGLNQTMQGTLNIIAPPLGAVLLGVLPLHGIMMMDVITAMLAVVPLFFVRIPRPKRNEAAQASGGLALVLSDTCACAQCRCVREGFRYVWSWPGMMLLGAIAAVLNFLFNPAFSLMPILVTRHFHGQALQTGLDGIGLECGHRDRRIDAQCVGRLSPQDADHAHGPDFAGNRDFAHRTGAVIGL